MNKEIKISLTDLYIGYLCTAAVLYAIGTVAYSVGKTKAKVEVVESIRNYAKANTPDTVAK